MHAVINHLHLTISLDQLTCAIEQEGAPLLSTLPGFHAVFFVKEADDRAAVIILWDSLEAAVNGSKTFGPTWFAQNIAPHLASEQVRSMGEVLAHRHK